MALVLTLVPKEEILIGDVVAYVEVSDDPTSISLNVGGKVHYVTDAMKVEVLPDVYVSAGLYNEQFQIS